MRWLVWLNRGIGWVAGAIGAVLAIFGVVIGFFGGINDGLRVGLGILGVAGAFGLAFIATGVCFMAVARAHAARLPARWIWQVLVPVAAFVFVGLAAEFSSVLEDWK